MFYKFPHNYNIQNLLYDIIDHDFLLDLLLILLLQFEILLSYFCQLNLSYLYYNKHFLYSFYYSSLN